jgi:hypothetical protein
MAMLMAKSTPDRMTPAPPRSIESSGLGAAVHASHHLAAAHDSLAEAAL